MDAYMARAIKRGWLVLSRAAVGLFLALAASL
jgi:hypothetical protein